MDPDLATPMVRIHNQDYYTFEITCLADGSLVIPFRWFQRLRHGSNAEFDMYGLGWKVHAEPSTQGYVVNKWDLIQFPVASLLIPFPRLVAQFSDDGMYDPRNIIGLNISFYKLSTFDIRFYCRSAKAAQ